MTGFVTQGELRGLLDLFMCSDPWPIEGEDGERAQHEIETLLDRYAQQENYRSWIEAYHDFHPGT